MSSVIESYVLRVTDLDKATEFWEKAIGAEVVSRSESDEATDVTLRSPIGGGGVTLRRVHGDDHPIEVGHSLFRQYMNTSDSAGLYRHAVNLGYDATHDPFDVPGRVNVVKSYTRQPDGYLMDLCEFQGEAGKRILHGQVDAKEHASGDKLATYIGPTAIYVTDMDKSVDFWTRLGSDERLYAKYKAIDAATLNAEQRQAHKNAIRNFVLGGAELTGTARERYAAIQERQAELVSHRLRGHGIHPEREHGRPVAVVVPERVSPPHVPPGAEGQEDGNPPGRRGPE